MLLADHERLHARGIGIPAAGRAVARRAARYRVNPRVRALARAEVCGDFLSGAPAAIRLADHKLLPVAGGIGGVGTAGRAIARCGARHRADAGAPALVQGPQPGHLDRAAPDAVHLADHETLLMAAAVPVGPDGRAAAWPRARHRVDGGVPALVQSPQARHLNRPAPPAVLLDDHEPLLTAVPVEPDGRAAAPRGARYRDDLSAPALVQVPQARHLDRLVPPAVLLDGHEPLPMAPAVRVEPDGGAAARRRT